MSTENHFIFKKQDKIGVADAQADKNTLLECFVDTGDYEAIDEFDRPERFILGRTGSGKTALITKLTKEHDNCIVIAPESLALGHISNSTILRGISELGVDLDIFFRLLWRHVLGVEILKTHFNITNEVENYSFLERLKQRFAANKNQNHLRALKYLENWGSSFWKDTDNRVKELTKKLESDVEASVGVSAQKIGAKVAGNQKITEEEKFEIVHRAQQVVNEVQMRELTDLMKMLDEAIEDKQKRYYLIIDRLDENWIEDDLRYKLIRALIETVKDFAVVEKVKPLIVLRTDLIYRVYDITRDTGFQEEKFTSLNLPIRWTRAQLITLLDKRIDFLVKQRYTTQKVTHKELLPENINGQETIDYILDRTLMRPRDVIQFFNLCIDEAVEEHSISEEMLLKAEREYSRDRLSAIADEWYGDYPTLKSWLKLIEETEKEFFIEDLPISLVEDISLKVEFKDDIRDKLAIIAKEYLEEEISLEQLRKEIVRVFYIIGVVGVKMEGQKEPIWSYEQRRNLNPGEIKEDTILCVHSCFWMALRTKK